MLKKLVASKLCFMLTLALFILPQASCNDALLNRTIAAFDYGPAAVKRFNLDADTEARWSTGFRGGAEALRNYQANLRMGVSKSEARKILVSDFARVSLNFTSTNNSEAQAWLNDVLALARLILGLPMETSAQRVTLAAQSNADPPELRESDVKRLERLMKGN